MAKLSILGYTDTLIVVWVTVTSEDVCWSIRNVKYINESFHNMRCSVMFITAVCLIFIANQIHGFTIDHGKFILISASSHESKLSKERHINSKPVFWKKEFVNIFSLFAVLPSIILRGPGWGGANVSCQLKFWPFVSCQLNLRPFVSCQLIGC